MHTDTHRVFQQVLGHRTAQVRLYASHCTDSPLTNSIRSWHYETVLRKPKTLIKKVALAVAKQPQLFTDILCVTTCGAELSTAGNRHLHCTQARTQVKCRHAYGGLG